LSCLRFDGFNKLDVKRGIFNMRKLTLFLVMVSLMVMAFPIAAQEEEGLPDFIQHSECQVDLTGETITIFHLGDISSPGYSPITLPLLAGLSDAIAYFNARGGVCGAMFASVNFDTGGDPNRTSADSVFVFRF
jgi:hypothetical protein